MFYGTRSLQAAASRSGACTTAKCKLAPPRRGSGGGSYCAGSVVRLPLFVPLPVIVLLTRELMTPPGS
jgi:hypothetical protein